MSDPGVYLQLGWRNLWLYPMRTGLTIVALALGISALTFLSAMKDGWVQQVQTNFARLLNGHIQVHAEGFEQNPSLTRRIENPGPLIDRLESEPMVAGLTRRIRVSGLASAAGANAGARVFAVEPEREQAFSQMVGFVSRGRWLSPGDDHDVVLGEGLANRLQVRLGNKVVLMVSLASGDIASEVFRVRGILTSGVMEIDNYAAVIPLSTGQRWLELEQSVTDVVVFTNDFKSVEPLVINLRQQLSGQRMEVLSWSDTDPVTGQLSQMANVFAWMILSIVIFVVMTEVLNTLLMSMHERIRELGLMTALGVTRRQIFTMIVSETLILVLIGSLVGFVTGACISAYFEVHGFDLSRFSEVLSFSYMESVVRPDLSVTSIMSILGAAVLGACVASLYPAWKAATLGPVSAMRRV